MLFLRPEGLSSEGVAVLASTLWIGTWWVTEAIPIPATSLLPLILLPLTNAVPGDDVASSYGDDIVFLFLGGFALAIAMEKWNLHQRIALTIVLMIGTSPRRIVLGFMVAVAFLSMWVTNTAAAMMMIPVALAVTYQAAQVMRGGEHESEVPKFEKCLIFGVGYAATIGGLGTLIGTPPLAFLSGVVRETFGETITFAQWMLFGVPMVILTLAFCWFYLTFVKFKFEFKSLPGGRDVIRDEKEGLGSLATEEKAVLAVFIGAAFFWVTRRFIWDDLIPGISDGLIAVTAAVVLFALPSRSAEQPRILEWDDTKKVPWGVLLLFGGGLAVAGGFTETGLSDWIGEQLLVLENVKLHHHCPGGRGPGALPDRDHLQHRHRHDDPPCHGGPGPGPGRPPLGTDGPSGHGRKLRVHAAGGNPAECDHLRHRQDHDYGHDQDRVLAERDHTAADRPGDLHAAAPAVGHRADRHSGRLVSGWRGAGTDHHRLSEAR